MSGKDAAGPGGMDRRSVIVAAGLGAMAAFFGPRRLLAAEAGGGLPITPAALVPAGSMVEAVAPLSPRHGLSVFGDLRYPPDFPHFDWVNPNAPKGGRIVFMPPSWGYNQNVQTFNTLNAFVLKGDAPPRMELTFASLMTRSLDEPDAVYGLAAETVALDGNRAVFALRDGLSFHDGSALTAGDVAFSLLTLKQAGHPLITEVLKEMVGAQAADPATVVVTFTGRQTRQLVQFVATLPIFSQAYYGSRDFGAATLQAPPGSGPYRVGRLEAGRFIEYERVAGWWGEELPAARGLYNFDTIRVPFFREMTVSFEALKKGDVTFREEFLSRNWVTGYDFPAARDGRVRRETFADDRPAGAQGLFLNMRRPPFADPRVREALGLAFDFEWSNKALFYGLYTRTQSYFQNSDMMAEGLPPAGELKLLEPFRDKVPPAVFGPAVTAPVSDGSGQDRTLLRQAARLLAAAGCVSRDGRLCDPQGRPFTLEFLESDPSLSRIYQPYIRNLKLLGIEATERVVDAVQYQSRLRSFDFDVTMRRFSLSATPGEEIRGLWSAAAARQDGSNNLSGIDNPAVDALVEAMVTAGSRADMTTAARALDRVLRALRPWVPAWYKPSYTVAFWDEFGYPPVPRYDFPAEILWWSKTAAGNG
ncbi:extracellular solute-binding protein [Pseudoxanthobacter sp.]|uniref:extracellular solute-binding protein n=1 Tax=Pseudoxanthobacter sp. TaxID=1925742 RepID=UPI002FE38479